VILVTAHNGDEPPKDRIVMKFDIYGIFRNSVVKIQVSLKYDKNNGYFT